MSWGSQHPARWHSLTSGPVPLLAAVFLAMVLATTSCAWDEGGGDGEGRDWSRESACNATTARLVLSSERNQTGDWVARVRLVHGDVDPTSWERWRVDAEHTVVSCEGREPRVLMEANVTIPRSAARPVTGSAPLSRRPAGGNGTEQESSDVRPDYTAVPRLGSAYKYHDDWRMWADARNVCEDEGAHLIVPNTEDEYNALAKMSSKHPWVGLFYNKEEGRYVTVHDEPLENLNYVRWGPGEPDKSGDCIFFQGLTKTLYDEPCGFVEVFVCETALYSLSEDS